jgi:hypothetical protein
MAGFVTDGCQYVHLLKHWDLSDLLTPRRKETEMDGATKEKGLV